MVVSPFYKKGIIIWKFGLWKTKLSLRGQTWRNILCKTKLFSQSVKKNSVVWFIRITRSFKIASMFYTVFDFSHQI